MRPADHAHGFTNEWAAIKYIAMDVPEPKRFKKPTKAVRTFDIGSYAGFKV